MLGRRLDEVRKHPLHAPENVAQMEAFFTKSAHVPLTPGFAADFDDQVLDARHWFSLKSVEPAQAAMLLCEFNPNIEELDHARQLTGLVTEPHDLQLLLQQFEDQARHDPRPRSLLQWLQLAQTAGLRYHPWVDAYIVARGVASPMQAESKVDRQDRRLRACEAAGLVMPASPHGRLPTGMGKVAAREGVTRQAFSEDVRAALKRRAASIREGATPPRAT